MFDEGTVIARRCFPETSVSSRKKLKALKDLNGRNQRSTVIGNACTMTFQKYPSQRQQTQKVRFNNSLAQTPSIA